MCQFWCLFPEMKEFHLCAPLHLLFCSQAGLGVPLQDLTAVETWTSHAKELHISVLEMKTVQQALNTLCQVMGEALVLISSMDMANLKNKRAQQLGHVQTGPGHYRIRSPSWPDTFWGRTFDRLAELSISGSSHRILSSSLSVQWHLQGVWLSLPNLFDTRPNKLLPWMSLIPGLMAWKDDIFQHRLDNLSFFAFMAPWCSALVSQMRDAAFDSRPR